MSVQKVNFNNLVQVQLTARGREILTRYYADQSRLSGHHMAVPQEELLGKMQLHFFIEVFGAHLGCAEAVVENMSFDIHQEEQGA